PTVPIPILKPLFLLKIDITQLTGSGFSLPDGLSPDPIEVAKVDFTLSGLVFANPNNGDTTDAQVKMQGGLSFDNVPLLQGAGNPADVKDTNYVIADHNGITITGATITKTWQLDKVKIAGGINVGYDMSSKTFTFGGHVEVTTEQQGNGKVALKQLAADIN